jgi:hypothetical protein
VDRYSAMWISHHYPHDYERCVRIGHSHVCRRCLWFYPVCLSVAALSVAGVHWPAAWDPWLLWLLPVPVVVEWWAEHLGRWSYSPVRNVALSVLVAPAVGRGLGRYLEHRADHLFWAVVVTYAVVCAVPFFCAPSFSEGRNVGAGTSDDAGPQAQATQPSSSGSVSSG